MKPSPTWFSSIALFALPALAASSFAGSARAQGAPADSPPPPAYAPAPGGYPPGYYAPPPGGYPPGYYAPPPGAYPPGYYPPPGAYPPGYYPPPAEEPAHVDPPATATHLGIGYKIGNGLGFLGGDIIVSPIPHVVLDLQANTFSLTTSSGTATGFGLAPALQMDIRPPGVSTPYIGVGWVYAKLSLNNVIASASGIFINAGYEWKWSFGMGIILGGGVCYLGKISATDGTTTITQDAQLLPSLEAGIRFMFL